MVHFQEFMIIAAALVIERFYFLPFFAFSFFRFS